MSPRFYFSGTLPRAGEIAFPPAAAHHALKVLRLAPGDAVTLFDGSGGELRARLDIRGRSAHAVDGQWLETDERESPLALVLVQALVSADKMDWAIQKAVELGASGFIPLLTARSLPHPGEARAARKIEHWQQTIIAACEQCGRNRLPFIAPVQNLASYLGRHKDAMRLIFIPGGTPLSAIRPVPSVPVHLLVGPEGGWREEEQMLCQRAGCQSIGMGPRILRTETAGLAAIAALQVLAGDF
ncbi:MAG: 16S rRNA (uracil(1498)-N(3))-methyltransferase [Azoarcus sp.]|jgi:16S rRNA (uracil1498-N3)-methyltransferase|nr:16S rRNA (uracil(1498)-N(3))-methyltransferase [Azoarcus sp.]